MIQIDEKKFWEEVKEISYLTEHRVFQDGGTVKEKVIDIDCLKEIIEEAIIR